MYDFDGDVSTTYTGQTDLHLSGILATYNRDSVLQQWEAPCNKLEGSSDGTKFPTGVKANESLRFFRKSMCRSVPMVSMHKLWMKLGYQLAYYYSMTRTIS